MKVLLLDAPQAMLDERRKLGLDGRDEMWNGVMHVVPPPSGAHQGLSSEFFIVVGPLAKRRGVVPRMETGLFLTSDDYRVPDQLYCRPAHLSERGAEGADAVVEVRSLGDETYRKMEFYGGIGVREVIVLHPQDRTVELFRAMSGELRAVSRDAEGALESDVLGIRLRTVDGKLRVTRADGSADL